jgi:uncharacterized protein YodC (DUF2158 family)
MASPAKPFQEGDKVQLKSGGPVMTVRVAPGRIAYCIWYVGGRRCQGTFEQEVLVRIEDDAIAS